MATPTALLHPELLILTEAVRRTVATHTDWQRTAERVADQLRRHLPTPDVLLPEHRSGDPERLRGHVLHVEPDGAFSVVALVLRPGQSTRIHDHLTWCAFGVSQGAEHEERFDDRLQLVAVNDNERGVVSGFAPPGDIHRVRNVGVAIAISLHIYGTDVSRVGSSVRRYYD